MATLVKVGNQYNIPVKQYYCDTQEDFAEIQEQNCPIGTEVYILQKNQIKVFGPNGWTNKASGGSGDEKEIDETILPLADTSRFLLRRAK